MKHLIVSFLNLDLLLQAPSWGKTYEPQILSQFFFILPNFVQVQVGWMVEANQRRGLWQQGDQCYTRRWQSRIPSCWDVTLYCYTALLHCTATLHCYTVLLHCTATLHCNNALLHCNVALHCYTALLHCTVTLHCYTALLHCTVILFCYTVLLHCSVTLHCYTALLHGYCTLVWCSNLF